jgi:hypothetical protein
MAMTDEALKTLLAGTVDSVTAAIQTMDMAELRLVHDAEKAGANRTTLMHAIHREMKERGSEPPASDDPAPDGPAADDMGSDGEAGPDTDDAVEAPASDPTVNDDGGVDPLDGTGDADPGDAPIVPQLADAHGAPDGAIAVLLIDDKGKPVEGLSELSFPASAFAARGKGYVLNRAIAIPGDVPAQTLIGVEVDLPAAIAARLVQPFPIGGGRATELPAGTLLFERVG